MCSGTNSPGAPVDSQPCMRHSPACLAAESFRLVGPHRRESSDHPTCGSHTPDVGMCNLREEYEGYLLALDRGGWAKATTGILQRWQHGERILEGSTFSPFLPIKSTTETSPACMAATKADHGMLSSSAGAAQTGPVHSLPVYPYLFVTDSGRYLFSVNS